MNAGQWAEVTMAGIELLAKLLGDRSPHALDAADDIIRSLLEGGRGTTSRELAKAEIEAIKDGFLRNAAERFAAAKAAIEGESK